MYRWTSHTGEEQLEIEADTPAAVFAEAVDAFGRSVELEKGGLPTSHAIQLDAGEPAELLVGLINELVFLADTEGFVPDRSELVLDTDGLRGEVHGRSAAVRPLVKAATYAGLAFEQTGGVWRARVVLDV